MRRPQLVGRIFEFLSVLSYHERSYYRCQCRCGKIVFVRSYELKTGLIKSCGCRKRKLLAERKTLPNAQGLINWVFRKYKTGALKRKYEFTLSKDKFEELIFSNCFYCGIQPSMKYTGTKLKATDTSQFKYNGVDRLDNTKGYSESNCVSCCKICNDAKGTLSLDSWNNWLTRITSFRTKAV